MLFAYQHDIAIVLLLLSNVFVKFTVTACCTPASVISAATNFRWSLLLPVGELVDTCPPMMLDEGPTSANGIKALCKKFDHPSFTVWEPWKLFGEGLLPFTNIVKSDGFFVPRSSLITFLSTVILPGEEIAFYRLTSSDCPRASWKVWSNIARYTRLRNLAASF